MFSQNELKDDKYVISSRLYTMRNDQLQHWNAEVERYGGLTDALQVVLLSFMCLRLQVPCILVLYYCLFKVYFQVDRSLVIRREKELNAKVESADVARNSIDNAESRIEELELQLQKCISEKNDLEIKMEEAAQDSGEIANLLIIL